MGNKTTTCPACPANDCTQCTPTTCPPPTTCSPPTICPPPLTCPANDCTQCAPTTCPPPPVCPTCPVPLPPAVVNLSSAPTNTSLSNIVSPNSFCHSTYEAATGSSALICHGSTTVPVNTNGFLASLKYGSPGGTALNCQVGISPDNLNSTMSWVCTNSSGNSAPLIQGKTSSLNTNNGLQPGNNIVVQ